MRRERRETISAENGKSASRPVDGRISPSLSLVTSLTRPRRGRIATAVLATTVTPNFPRSLRLNSSGLVCLQIFGEPGKVVSTFVGQFYEAGGKGDATLMRPLHEPANVDEWSICHARPESTGCALFSPAAYNKEQRSGGRFNI